MKSEPAVPLLWMVRSPRQDSAPVGSCWACFRWWAWKRSDLPNVSWVTAVYCSTKALVFSVFVKNVWPSCIKGSQNSVEWGEPERYNIRFQPLASSGMASRSVTQYFPLGPSGFIWKPDHFMTRFEILVRLHCPYEGNSQFNGVTQSWEWRRFGLLAVFGLPHILDVVDSVKTAYADVDMHILHFDGTHRLFNCFWEHLPIYISDVRPGPFLRIWRKRALTAKPFNDGQMVLAHVPFCFISQGWVDKGYACWAKAACSAAQKDRGSVVEVNGEVSDDPFVVASKNPRKDSVLMEDSQVGFFNNSDHEIDRLPKSKANIMLKMTICWFVENDCKQTQQMSKIVRTKGSNTHNLKILSTEVTYMLNNWMTKMKCSQLAEKCKIWMFF